jgi:phosphatidylglycerophosphate synthase
MEPANRRQLATRARRWPSILAGRLARLGVSPNQISIASIVFAALAGWAFLRAGDGIGDSASFWLVLAAAGIQLRLLCNLLDGLLAIEGGLKSPTGELFNEIPDRIADILILLGAGFAVKDLGGGLWFGVLATILALLTAYVRLLGGSLGFAHDFGGPMAKQHRMFTLTVGALAGAIEHATLRSIWAVYVALVVIVAGTLVTLVLRTHRIARALGGR